MRWQQHPGLWLVSNAHKVCLAHIDNEKRRNKHLLPRRLNRTLLDDAFCVKCAKVLRSLQGITDTMLKEISLERLEEILSENTSLLLIAPLAEPNVSLLAASFEYSYFPPDTAGNESFDIFYVGWKQTLWVILKMPLSLLSRCLEFSRSLDLHIEKGIPVLGEYAQDEFPAKGKNCFVLQYKYRDQLLENPHALREFRKEELEKVTVIFETHKKDQRSVEEMIALTNGQPFIQ